MRVLLAHNDYGQFSGEEAAVENVAAVLLSHHHQVVWLRSSSANVRVSALEKAKAFFSGIYSVQARKEILSLLEAEPFDIVQVQNLYPFLSASILPACRRKGIPVVMRCPNYRLFCPSGLHLRAGKVCEDCLGGLREWHCVAHNCEADILKSLGYAARNAFARLTSMIIDNVTVFVVLTEFQKERFKQAGIPQERIEVLSNPGRIPRCGRQTDVGRYVSFVGRVSREKGVTEFLNAARRLPNVLFRIAGSTSAMPEIEQNPPPNVELMGFVSGDVLEEIYQNTRILVSPSTCFEGFPNAIAQAMAHGKPVVATRIGAAPEIVDDGVTGLLVNPCDARDLADKIAYLWQRPALCREMGRAGREKASAVYSEELFYQRLMEIYAKATALCIR
ncbi:glycosyltransferase family 4 protein [Thiocapsa bogorovii]|uniref:glycosyltransferase family 4 protein n=1 Tax=Thiocapsa bogorovii TaxID=521689 RepID=UPI001E4DBC80|nr:glycosyltransferase family 4 protein [Thiocapsa bogorovii]UHD16236.1 glycosyltransferase family 4 protein [Thiocapsa bogorovii]